jgi:hypothetical protein
MRADVPLVVVGCGPAGLAAAWSLWEHAPGLDWLALEAGGALRERRRGDPGDVTAGVGGAGLYSDGKFSFYPAAGELWRLPDGGRLLRSYAWVRSLLGDAGQEAPAFPEEPHAVDLRSPYKPYTSLCLDFPTRRELIERMSAPLAGRVWLRTTLLDLRRDPAGLRLVLDRAGRRVSLRTRALLCAGGRFFPLRFGRCAGGRLPMRFGRWEVGIRIEGATGHPFFRELQSLGARDPKLILRAEGRGVEWRTFCCCIDGEVIESRCDGFTTLSGRADVSPTGRSNIGFNVRFLEGEEDLLDLARLRRRRPFGVPFPDVLEGAKLDGVYGPAAAEELREGLRRLCLLFGSIRSGAARLTAAGPTLEGVGYYPRTTGLALEDWPVYFAGDACGRFRGLVAALVSGAYAGGLVSERLAADQPARPLARFDERPGPQPLASRAAT